MFMSYPVAAFLAVSVYVILLGAYRLYLSPIAKFPGPRLAALSRWYEFYYEVVRRGKFSRHISELHKQYGLSNRSYHSRGVAYSRLAVLGHLYAPGRVDKYKPFSYRHGIPESVFATSNHHLHRGRRGPLNPLFSKRRISEFQPIIQRKLNILCSKLDNYVKDGRYVVLSRALLAYSGDVITYYVSNRSYEHLESPDFKDTFHEAWAAANEAGHVCTQFTWLNSLMNMLPDNVVLKLQPLLAPMLRLRRDFTAELEALDVADLKKNLDHTTILYEMIKSDLPEEEKTVFRLVQESLLIIGAGMETVSWTLTVAAFHITDNPDIYARLHNELVKAIPSRNAYFTWEDVENLPYLNACIKEALRLSYGVSARNPRIRPTTIQYKHWTIPPNVPVSTSVIDHNHNEDIFPDSHAYKPERWLDSNLDKWLHAFGKGSRTCLGINLAYAEMHMALAGLFRRYMFELYETDVSDAQMAHDFFLPAPKLDSKGVRVTVKAMS